MITCYRLGRVEYADGLELQRQFVESRRAGLCTDTLLLLEHPPVLTLGRAAKEGANIIAPRERLDALGVRVFHTDRGGDVTYHGPGQLVAYPLLHLPGDRQDVRRYVRDLEEVVIRTLASFGLAATRMTKWPGVWIERSRAGGPKKICALGVHLSRWYTRHGVALNVEPALEHFELIVPCGIREAGVTSIAAELGQAPPMAEVEQRLAERFAEVFASEVREAPPIPPTVSVTVVREGRVLALERSPTKGGWWQPVTGRVEPHESPAQAAARELYEETGLALPVAPLDYVHVFPWGSPRLEDGRPIEPPRLGREHAYSADAPRGATVTLGREHARYEWLEPQVALERFPHEGLREAARRAIRAWR